MAIPEPDLDRIQLWCREQWPEHMWDKVKCDADISGHRVDVVEVRPVLGGTNTAEDEPIREWVARLPYTVTTGMWSIYWCDSNFTFHEYKYKRRLRNRLLEEFRGERVNFTPENPPKLVAQPTSP